MHLNYHEGQTIRIKKLHQDVHVQKPGENPLYNFQVKAHSKKRKKNVARNPYDIWPCKVEWNLKNYFLAS